eukprot:Clim_evm40s231 gene=Clim_evmTU40s231
MLSPALKSAGSSRDNSPASSRRNSQQNKRRVSFNEAKMVLETYDNNVYNRESWNIIPNVEHLDEIKMELTWYKRLEMPVHPDSIQYISWPNLE